MAPPDQFAKSAWMSASIAVVVAALYLAKGVLIPLTLAVLLSFLLSPVCDWLERRGLGRIPAVLVTAILGFAILGVATWTAVVQMTELAPRVPEYRDNLEAKLRSTNTYVSDALNKMSQVAQGFGQNLTQLEPTETPQGTDERPYSVRVLSSPASPLQVLGGTLGALLQLLGTAGIVIVLVVFFLVRRDDLRDRFIRLVGTGEVTVTTQMLEDAATRVSRYLSMLFVINATFGIAIGGGLYLIGVPNAVLWGIVAATLRFIPYIGPWIAAAMPIGLSMAISTGWGSPILTVILFVVLELLSNNVVEPWLYGRNTGISAAAILVAAVFWTWLWGIAGLLMATPLTVCLLVIGKHVPQLSFLDTMLGNEPVFEPKKRIYQRLLAGDQEEAAELIDEYLEKQPPAEVYDTVLIPALAYAETHWRRGELDERRHAFILQSLSEIVEELGRRAKETQARDDGDATETAGGSTSAAKSDAPAVYVLCLPARDEGDEIAAMMLAQLLESSGYAVQAPAIATPAAEMIDLVERRRPAVVCISATPPAAVIHARALTMRLLARMPNVNVVVGLWDRPGDLKNAERRIGGGERVHVVVKLADARDQVRRLIRPPSLAPPFPPPQESAQTVVEEVCR